MKRVKLAKVEPDEKGDSDTGLLVINIDKTWRLAYDGLQFQVQEAKVFEKGKQTGNTFWKCHGYFRYLDNAIMFFARRQIYFDPDTYDGRALKIITDMTDRLEATCKGVCADMAAKLIEMQRLKLEQAHLK